MANVRKCDICGSIYKHWHPIDEGFDTTVEVFVNRHHPEPPYRTSDPIDCCPACADNILRFIDIMKTYPNRWCIDILNES